MDLTGFDSWIGNKERSLDDIPLTLVKRMAATFGVPCPSVDGPLPHLWHWAFFQEPVFEEDIGVDGHPKLGTFLPPLKGRIRMWAGGRIKFFAPLLVGREAERYSDVVNVVEKEGQSGSLVFVTVRHRYSQDEILCIEEEQDIVYRYPSAPAKSSKDSQKKFDWASQINPSTVMLFRYSAVTFNGHRIHYDYPYVTGKEGYQNLVVHGPLIATLLLSDFLKNNPDKDPERFEFRGIRPLTQGEPFQLGGRLETNNSFELCAFNENGPAHNAKVFCK
ncbi:transposase [Marinobacter sp. Z-F4-2]|nr:transposase [Marinobacter sp. Z-F4-2]